VTAKPEAFLKGLSPLPSFLSFAPPDVGELERKYVLEALESGWLTTGPRAERFEAALASRLGTSGALAVSSCTAALHLAMRVLDLGPAHAAITTPLTFASTAHAIAYVGARPLLADVSSDTGNLDPAEVDLLIERECRPGPDGRPVHLRTGRTVAAIVAVHYGGHPADLEGLWKVALRRRLHLVEDAAHALGTTLGGLPAGHPGLVPAEARGLGLRSLCCLSFYATKNITTGEGGLLTCSDPALLARARRLSAYGISDARRIWGRYAPQGTWVYDVAELGLKCNLGDLQAALGLAQMERLDELLAARAKRAAIWLEALSGLEARVELPAARPGAGHSWHLFPLRIRPEGLAISRDQLVSALRALNVGTSVMFIPVHYHSYYQAELGYQAGDFPSAEDFFRRVLSLPVSPASPEAAIEAAASLLRQLLIRNAK
jgi:dTDP-4-amino-4,6-dideoxygalactose transaminase